MANLQGKLITAVTEYDRKQSSKRGYNPHALGQYLAAIDEALGLVSKGKSIEYALSATFTDRLLNICLRAIAAKE